MPVRFGILGAGYMAHTYAECLARHVPDGSLAAIALGSGAPALAERYGVSWEPSMEALLGRSDVEAVILATPHSAHLPETCSAAAAGKHVYAEKPMARNLAECDGMIEACAAAGVQLAVNKVTRFRDSPLTARRLIDEGAVGELRMIRGLCAVPTYHEGLKPWVHDPDEGGAWLDWGAHGCDTLRWLTNSEATSVFAWVGDWSPPPLLRNTMAQFRFRSGVTAQLMMSFEMPTSGFGSQSWWEIVGSRAVVELDAYGKVFLISDGKHELVFEQPAFDLNTDPVSPVRLKAFAAQLQDFCRAVLDRREPVVTGADGRAAVEMVEAGKRSSLTGQAVSLPLAG